MEPPSSIERRRRTTVIHLSSGHHPDDARIYWKECASLAQAGYAVAFIVPEPRQSHRPRKLLDQIDVISIPGRASRLGRFTLLPFSIFIAAIRQNGDVYHFHDPELLPVGFILRLLGKRVIYDVHEDLPRDISTKAWIPRPIRGLISRLAEAVEWIAGWAMSGIVAATPVIAKRFPQDRTALVQNFARAEEFEFPRAALSVATPLIAYVGNIAVERCAIEMVCAMCKVSSSPSPRLALLGPMASAKLHASLAALPGWEHVDYHGLLDRDGVRSVLSQASVGLVLLHPTQVFIDSQPVKLFEYMAAGVPVIAADFPRLRNMVESVGCGLCVQSRDVDAIAAAIDHLLANPKEAQAMGQRGRALMSKSFSWESESRALLRLYERVAGPCWGPPICGEP